MLDGEAEAGRGRGDLVSITLEPGLLGFLRIGSWWGMFWFSPLRALRGETGLISWNPEGYEWLESGSSEARVLFRLLPGLGSSSEGS